MLNICKCRTRTFSFTWKTLIQQKDCACFRTWNTRSIFSRKLATISKEFLLKKRIKSHLNEYKPAFGRMKRKRLTCVKKETHLNYFLHRSLPWNSHSRKKFWSSERIRLKTYGVSICLMLSFSSTVCFHGFVWWFYMPSLGNNINGGKLRIYIGLLFEINM